MKPILQIMNLRKLYGDHAVLQGLNLELQEGEILAIIGPSGVGKSTLLRLIDLLEPPTDGQITFQGTQYQGLSRTQQLQLRRQMGLVLQKPIVFNMSVYDNVAYGLRLRDIEDSVIRNQVNQALALLRIEDLARKRATRLSGGEQQRVALARTIVTKPKLLLLDEPTANLDPLNIMIIEDTVKAINRDEKTAFIMVTHNMFQAKRTAQRVAFMNNGSIVEVGSVEQLFNAPRDQATRAFIRGESIF